MNFVPKERSKKTIQRLIDERQERKRREFEAMKKEYENSKNKSKFNLKSNDQY